MIYILMQKQRELNLFNNNPKPESSQIVYAIIPGALIIEPEIYTNGVSILGFMSVLCLTVAILTPIGNLSLIVAKKAVNYFLPPKQEVIIPKTPKVSEEPINGLNLVDSVPAKQEVIKLPLDDDPFSLIDFLLAHPFLSIMHISIVCLGIVFAAFVMNVVVIIIYKILGYTIIV